MDLEEIYFKTFQYRLNTYCFTRKPYISLSLRFNQYIDSTYLRINPTFYQMNRGDQWTKQFCVMSFNEKYPLISFSTIPFNFLSFDLVDDKYSIHFKPNHYSMCFKFIQDVTVKYFLSYISDTTPSFLGGFNVSDLILLSARINEKKFSLFYKLNNGYKSFFFFGLKLSNNNSSFFDSLTDIHIGFQTPIFSSIYSFGLGISEPLELSISRRKKNRRLTYIFKKAFSNDENNYVNYHYLQYKYVSQDGIKIGALYDFSKDELFVRGSLRFNDYLKLKLSTQYNGEWCNPTFGFDFNFNKF